QSMHLLFSSPHAQLGNSITIPNDEDSDMSYDGGDDESFHSPTASPYQRSHSHSLSDTTVPRFNSIDFTSAIGSSSPQFSGLFTAGSVSPTSNPGYPHTGFVSNDSTPMEEHAGFNFGDYGDSKAINAEPPLNYGGMSFEQLLAFCCAAQDEGISD